MTDKISAERRTMSAAILAGLGLSAFGIPVRAADYPSRPVKIIHPWPAGGAGDVVVRILAPGIGERLGAQVVVDNRPGATGAIGSAAAAKSPPDGYTLVTATADSHSLLPHLRKSMPYDARKDFTPIAPIGVFPFGLIVHPSLPVRTVQELVQHSRTNKVSYGSWGIGSSGHLLGEALKAAAGFDMLHVPFVGVAPMLVSLLSGQVQAAVVPMPSAEQHVAAGSIRLLGVAARQRLQSFPALPTLREQGLAVEVDTWVGIMGPANLPADVVYRLNRAVSESLKDPVISERLRSLHVLADSMTPTEYQNYLQQDFERWGAVVKRAGVALD